MYVMVFLLHTQILVTMVTSKMNKTNNKKEKNKLKSDF